MITRPNVTQAAEGLPRRRFTVVEVEAMVAAGIMDHHERTELIGGELVPMSPKGDRHEQVKTDLLHRWYNAAPEEIGLVPPRHTGYPRTPTSNPMSSSSTTRPVSNA